MLRELSMLKERRRLAHLMPDLSPILRDLTYSRPGDQDCASLLNVSPQAVDHAIFEAVSTSNSYLLEALTCLPLIDSADGETDLEPVTAEKFIAMAQYLDHTAIEVMCRTGYGVLPI